MQIKCSGATFPAVYAFELPNRRVTKIIQHVFIGQYRIQVEFGKYGLPPFSFREPPQLGVEIFIFEESGQSGPIQYKWIRWRKID